MKLENVSVESMDLSFEIATPGVSICQFEEGIQKMTNEKSGKTTLRLPLQIIQVVEGEEGNIGRSFSLFIPIETSFGEKQLQAILSMTGLLDGFRTKFPDEIDLLEEEFINTLAVKLLGKRIRVTHDLRKDQQGKDRVTVLRLEKIAKPAPTSSRGTATKIPQATQSKAKADW